ncbi:histone acetyltransferase HPA2 and related acetyltransferases [Lachnospiraceae bacterium KM106-2]|nr:histone acetyltransferase HPA2 and related acetyltransferases [Lachnospiraceae bacterium KM106-2]
MTFRFATEQDYSAVENLFYQIFRKHLDSRPDIFHNGSPLSEDSYRSMLKDPYDEFLLCEIDKKAVGVCHYKRVTFEDCGVVNNRTVLYIQDYGVDKAYLRQGIGTLLFSKVKERARQWNVNSIELNVWDFNQDAKLFYHQMGFTPRNTRMEFLI